MSPSEPDLAKLRGDRAPPAIDPGDSNTAVLMVPHEAREPMPLLLMLEDKALDVTYVEFNGGHQFPLQNAARAVKWWLGADYS